MFKFQIAMILSVYIYTSENLRFQKQWKLPSDGITHMSFNDRQADINTKKYGFLLESSTKNF